MPSEPTAKVTSEKLPGRSRSATNGCRRYGQNKTPTPFGAGDPGSNDPEQVESYTYKYRRRVMEMQGLFGAGCANMVLTERPETSATERNPQQERVAITHGQIKT